MHEGILPSVRFIKPPLNQFHLCTGIVIASNHPRLMTPMYMCKSCFCNLLQCRLHITKSCTLSSNQRQILFLSQRFPPVLIPNISMPIQNYLTTRYSTSFQSICLVLKYYPTRSFFFGIMFSHCSSTDKLSVLPEDIQSALLSDTLKSYLTNRIIH